MPVITDPPGPWWKRLAWFVAIWAASVAALGAAAYAIRLWIA
ncbi:MAG TPA: DUF2474 family protein [Sphingomonas sp.]|nr:DUF2474 family protein [Sphingomonas sp.]